MSRAICAPSQPSKYGSIQENIFAPSSAYLHIFNATNKGFFAMVSTSLECQIKAF